MRMGATVILMGLYTRLVSNWLGSGVLPPAIIIMPRAMMPPAMPIQI